MVINVHTMKILMTQSGRVKKPVEAPKGASCWNCHYKINKQQMLFGACNYFKEINQEPKEIPRDIVNKGCKYYFDKNNHHPVIERILTLFEGEFLPDEKKYVYKESTYKREYKDNRNKYGNRADWD